MQSRGGTVNIAVGYMRFEVSTTVKIKLLYSEYTMWSHS